MRLKRQRKNQNQPNSVERNPRLPFIEHVIELRKRLFYVALSVILWAIAAYAIQQHIVTVLLKPSHNQQFIYTSVGGGINFLFQVSIYVGIALSIPVIVFQTLKYMEPLIKKDSMRFVISGSIASGILALAGILFGYFIGLPAALHFLLHQFTTSQIHPLLTIQSYMSFVTMYICGSALLFQLPLILIFINRIKPLDPKKLFGYERWVILIAFITGGLMNPSPRLQDQLLLAGPMIIAYQVGILIIWRINKHGMRSSWLTDLMQKDTEQQELRLSKFQEAQIALQQKIAAQQPQLSPDSVHTKPAAVAPLQTVAAHPSTKRPIPPQNRGKYINDFSMRKSALASKQCNPPMSDNNPEPAA